MVGTTRRRQPYARQVSTSETSSAVGSSKPVITTSFGPVLGDDLLEVRERSEAGESGSASPPACSLTVPITSMSGPRPSRLQRALEHRELAERADEQRAAAHAEQPHQLQRDAVVARAQQRHEVAASTNVTQKMP